MKMTAFVHVQCYFYVLHVGLQRGPKVTSHVACSSHGRCTQHLRRIRGCDAHIRRESGVNLAHIRLVKPRASLRDLATLWRSVLISPTTTGTRLWRICHVNIICASCSPLCTIMQMLRAPAARSRARAATRNVTFLFLCTFDNEFLSRFSRLRRII
jgi:hypothetical protein